MDIDTPFDPATGSAPVAEHATVAHLTVTRIEAGRIVEAADRLAEEVAVALVYNGISHAVMMATPEHLDDLGLGFSLTEGILETAGELHDLEIVEGCQGIEVRMEISSRRFVHLKERRRSLAGRTGCGVCGLESLESLAAAPRRALKEWVLKPEAVARSLEAMQSAQPLRDVTGATHATAWMDAGGRLLAVREDVGRHNALDKLIGHLAADNADPAQGFVVTSSRASYEMVQKTIAAGIGCLVAVSAPTALAVRMAKESGLTLAGFARGQRLVLYSGRADAPSQVSGA